MICSLCQPLNLTQALSARELADPDQACAKAVLAVQQHRGSLFQACVQAQTLQPLSKVYITLCCLIFFWCDCGSQEGGSRCLFCASCSGTDISITAMGCDQALWQCNGRQTLQRYLKCFRTLSFQALFLHSSSLAKSWKILSKFLQHT